MKKIEEKASIILRRPNPLISSKELVYPIRLFKYILIE